MFSLFKKNKITTGDLNLLKSVAERLPEKYNYLLQQLNPNFVLGKEVNKLGESGTYTLLLNANLESRFRNLKVPNFFILSHIKVWNKTLKRCDFVELHVVEGMLSGYRSTAGSYDVDGSIIDVSSMEEKQFNNDDKDQLTKLLKEIIDDVEQVFNLKDTYKVNLPEGDFFVLRSMGEGNYLSIDSDKKVYLMIHDPYEIEMISDNLAEFIRKLKKGSFNLDAYYHNKLEKKS